MDKYEKEAIALWTLGFPAITAWLGYGVGWFGQARLPGEPLMWAWLGAIVGITPAVVVGILTVSLLIAGAITRSSR